MKKKIFAVMFICVFFLLATLLFASAETLIFGNTSPASYDNMTANLSYGNDILVSGAYSTYQLNYVSAYMNCLSANAKCAIWFVNGTLWSVSSDVVSGSGVSMRTFGFNLVLQNNTHYYVGVIVDGNARLYASSSGSPAIHGTNVYSSPTDWSSGGGGSGFYCLYMTTNSIPNPTPTPSPSPSPSPSPAPTATPTAAPTSAPLNLSGLSYWIMIGIILAGLVALAIIVARARLINSGDLK